MRNTINIWTRDKYDGPIFAGVCGEGGDGGGGERLYSGGISAV